MWVYGTYCCVVVSLTVTLIDGRRCGVSSDEYGWLYFACFFFFFCSIASTKKKGQQSQKLMVLVRFGTFVGDWLDYVARVELFGKTSLGHSFGANRVLISVMFQ